MLGIQSGQDQGVYRIAHAFLIVPQSFHSSDTNLKYLG